jgi:putative beta-barrel porin BBP2
MMERYFRGIFVLLLVLILALPSLAFAFPAFDALTKGGVSVAPGDMRVGRVQLHPGFAFETRYDSNILNEADQRFDNGNFEGRTGDLIFTNIPSMGIALDRAPGEVFGFYFDYEGKDENFLEEGGSQSFFNHEMDGGINLGGPGGRADVTIGAGWEKAAGGTVRDFNSNIGARQSRITIDNFVDMRYAITKTLNFQLGATSEKNTYQGTDAQNVDEYNLGGSLFWQATKPAAFGVKYNHRARRYEFVSAINDDSDADQAYLAVRWVPTSLISGEIAVGYDTKRYKNFKGDNNQNLVFLVDLLYQPVQRTSVAFTGGRDIVDSTFGTIQAYVLTSAGVVVKQLLGKKVEAYVDILYENLNYQRSAPDNSNGGVRTRIDHQIATTIGLTYEIQKWLEAKASYRWEENISNFDAVDYVKHVGRLEIAAKY